MTHPCGGLMTVKYVMETGRQLVFETVSLPVEPDTADAAPQLLICNTLLDGKIEVTLAKPSRSIPATDDFRYVDVGAGLPPG